MKKLYLGFAVLFSACQTTSPEDINIEFSEWSSKESGTILRQSSEKIRDGFYSVKQSIVNSPEHWEGVGHFSSIFHHKIKICQCSTYDTVISPKGNYIIYFSNVRRQLELYNTRSKTTSVISKEYTGYPTSAEWDLDNKIANVILTDTNSKPSREIKVELE